MRTLLLLLAVTVLGMVSCKKDNPITTNPPANNSSITGDVYHKSDLTSYDAAGTPTYYNSVNVLSLWSSDSIYMNIDTTDWTTSSMYSHYGYTVNGNILHITKYAGADEFWYITYELNGDIFLDNRGLDDPNYPLKGTTFRWNYQFTKN